MWNIAQNTPLPPDWRTDVELCFNPNPPADAKIALAITWPAFMVHPDYYPIVQKWIKDGAEGLEPDKTPYLVPKEKVPNTMDLCTQPLKELGTPTGSFYSLDGATIAKVQEPAFYDSLKIDVEQEDGTVKQVQLKPIDSLGEALSGTLLHEVSSNNSYT